MNRRGFLAGASALAMAPFFSLAGCAGSGGARIASPDRLHHLRYGFTLENPGSSTLANQTLWCYAPVRASGAQRLTRLSVSLPYRELADGYGHTILQVTIPAMAPYATQLVRVEADLELLDRPQERTLEHADELISSAPHIESTAPEVVALAAILKAKDAYVSARAIYDWVKSEVRYSGFMADDLGALYALRERRGDCTEYAYLVCALARACGIPARIVGGYVVQQNTILRAEDYHNWAEVFIEGRWWLVDAQKQQFMPTRNSYVVFEVISPRNGNSLKGAHRYRMEGTLRASMS